MKNINCKLCNSKIEIKGKFTTLFLFGYCTNHLCKGFTSSIFVKRDLSKMF